jgi:hypothetical protein
VTPLTSLSRLQLYYPLYPLVLVTQSPCFLIRAMAASILLTHSSVLDVWGFLDFETVS